ncbi:hypothetical protein [Rhodococcus sp. ARC_M6]|uniref:hypothetical protein n=1 Tax=Rhodococcus sp. ARC_M6 TaxID=2928852 RepID=UPI001FB3BB6C|nr:hypothetical protein [Rhodococcus sp. ARC_M6]MCJ0907474.1 hypothetical protein [Rhodococcus sp. ARC_M6]
MFDWTRVSRSTQSAVADVSPTIPEANSLVAQPSWWRTIAGRPVGYPQLTDSHREELRNALASLPWPLREEGREIRLVAIAEDVAARSIAHPAWTHLMLDAHRSVLGLAIELHTLAAAAHQLLTVRAARTDIQTDDGSDVLARARAEWERRHVVAAQAESALIDQVAALRADEDALTPIVTSLRNLRVVTELAAGGGDVDRLYQQIVGSELAIGHTATLRGDVDDVRAGLDAQVAYLDSLIGPRHSS